MVVAVLVPALLVTPQLRSAETGDREHVELISKKDSVDLAIEKGLAWIATQQDASTGVFQGPLPNTFTALACIAFMAAGHQPGRSLYGENLRRGIQFLLRAAQKGDWYFGREGNGRMYTHGIATLALLEAYGIMEDEKENQRIKEVLENVLKVTLASQSKTKGQHHGGWRYEPTSGDGDLSVSVWQILVLRSAQNSNFPVPEQAVKDAMEYIRRQYNPQAQAFTYQGAAANNTPAMAPAGVVAMNVLGLNQEKADVDKIRNSARMLLTFDPSGGSYYYYMCYYLATAANMMGDEYRAVFLPKMENALLRIQQPDGAFPQQGDAHAGVYSTAFAVIILCVRYQYLPIYQE